METNKNDYIIGIDLGTTYSCVGVYKNDKIEIIPNSNGFRLTPSCVSFRKKERLIGRAAKNIIAQNPENTIYDIKRLIGRNFSEESVQNDIKLWPFKVEKDEDSDKPMISVTINDELEKFYPQQISAMILSDLKKTAEDFIGNEVKDAVITVPAYFNAYQKKATKEAGEIAGLNVIKLINEPTAAAIAYGLNNYEENKIILVFDLGGGTYDVSILKIANNKFQVLAINGDTHLGGEDFDNELVKYLAKQFENEYGINIMNNNRAKGRLKKECEKAKIDLSNSKETTIYIDCIVEGIDLNYNMNRADLEEICKDLFQKCIPPIKEALKDADLKVDDINEVVLVGGSSRIPKIQQLIEDFFGKKILSKKINPDEVVAEGATIQAAIINKEKLKGNFLITDINPFSLGTNVRNKQYPSMSIMSIIIHKNQPLPCKIKQNYFTISGYQKRVKIDIYQGENKYVKDNIYIGGFKLKIIKPQIYQIKINVTMELDENGILKVEAEEEENSNNKKEIIIEDVFNLTKEQIEKFKQKELFFQKNNQINKNITILKNKLKQFIYKQKEIANQYTLEKKNYIFQVLENAKIWLNNDNIKDYEINKKIVDLQTLINK